MSAAIASNRGKGSFFPADAPKVQRPRSTSVTHVLDRLKAITPEEIADLAPYIDVAKIGWGLPLLLPRERLRARIKLYQEEGIEVSTGGTLLEYAFAQNRVAAFLDEARGLGFDLIEVSSGILELTPTQVARLADAVRDHGLPVPDRSGEEGYPAPALPERDDPPDRPRPHVAPPQGHHREPGIRRGSGSTIVTGRSNGTGSARSSGSTPRRSSSSRLRWRASSSSCSGRLAPT